ncbi:hypothetical protein MWMV17_MWMV17_00378 [Acinetobacter calcoaceticus]|uniref:Uncharacterized protein n=1 Tax=Acinetobacter calcoaceticus DSM 30006 = CIP 81.8 TaxID=981331 RepID=A0ABN0K586_ACICA|nr:hypothetical protein [Acinetobacter calcoaceticus]ENU09452.1 hypothetical protein F997_02901 [Acinetobacter calcoaceticus NIPH 13]ENV98701.1 hypothetical protein F936_01784 [Acinetobacter calcoaceticus DSM 30006 = CIP 81.8]KJH63050.1 hypothetical protein UF12_06805 [Acinetobacter calcoaceticus]WNY30357.1 hypothetical protein Q4S33_14765 [Acinetobacter calcoaceticus]CAI3105957.1 hypothetical protein MWMV17_MWMV17_00378 [Acinetobacter calcoaceticus]
MKLQKIYPQTIGLLLLGSSIAGCGDNDTAYIPPEVEESCPVVMDEKLFADAKTLEKLVQVGPNIAQLRSTGSQAHNQLIDWIELEAKKIPGMQVYSDRFDIQRWQPIVLAEDGKGRSLLRSGQLSVNGRDIPIAGVVPYSLGTLLEGNTGQLVFLASNQPITAEHKGKIIVREIPTAKDAVFANIVAPPYAFLFQFAKYLSPLLDDLKTQRYDKPFLAAQLMNNDLVAAGKVGAAGLILGFSVPQDQVKDYFDPHNGLHYRLPAVFLGADEFAEVKELAENNTSGRIVVQAERDIASTRNLIATLPGMSPEKVVFVANTDGNTWVQENGVAGIIALAQYFAKIPLKCRPKTYEFAFNTAHLHMSKEGTIRYMKELDKEYKEKKVSFVFAIEHLGTQEIVAKPRKDNGLGQKLEFSGRAEPQAWFVPEDHTLMQNIAIEAAKRHKLPSVLVTTGQDAPDPERLPKQCSFGGIGTASHRELIPTMATISGPWSLWAPSFGKEAIDFNLMRNQLLAIGDSVLSLQTHSRAEIEGPYAAWRVARDQGKLVCSPEDNNDGIEDASIQ